MNNNGMDDIVGANQINNGTELDGIIGAGQIKSQTGVKIKIIGTGGAGSNSVTAAYKEYYDTSKKQPTTPNQHNNINNEQNSIDFIICNTDIQALRTNATQALDGNIDKNAKPLKKILLGPESSKGSGAGGIPSEGKKATEESKF
ncbi:MAG: hypothetical protein AAFO15_02480 [Pseudomonadota bacterium]